MPAGAAEWALRPWAVARRGGKAALFLAQRWLGLSVDGRSVDRVGGADGRSRQAGCPLWGGDGQLYPGRSGKGGARS